MALQNEKNQRYQRRLEKHQDLGGSAAVLNDSSVLNKSVLQSKAALSRITATVSHSYCLPPLTGSYLKRDRWNNNINSACCQTGQSLGKSSHAVKMALLACFLVPCFTKRFYLAMLAALLNICRTIGYIAVNFGAEIHVSEG